MSAYELSAFSVVDAGQIEQWLNAHAKNVFDLVREDYLAIAQKQPTNPDSYWEA